MSHGSLLQAILSLNELSVLKMFHKVLTLGAQKFPSGCFTLYHSSMAEYHKYH